MAGERKGRTRVETTAPSLGATEHRAAGTAAREEVQP